MDENTVFNEELIDISQSDTRESVISVPNTSDVEISSNALNSVDNLLKSKFLTRPRIEQLEIKKLGPHQPRNVQIHQMDKKQNRFFSEKWYDKVEWLTVSERTKSFFCFYCLLFGGENTWCKTGYSSIKHLSEKVKLHENTSAHISNTVKYKLFGIVEETVDPVTCSEDSIAIHNKMVDKNRYILNLILNCLTFCATHDLPIPSNSKNCVFNREVFLNLILEASKYDKVLCEYLNSNSTYTSEDVQNELLDCMYQIYKDEMMKDLERANYVSLHVEKIPDISTKAHFAVIMRYMKDGIAVERLYSLIETDQTTEALVACIKEQLEPLDLQCKLIGQTYDGTVTARGPYGGIQNCLKTYFPHALFLHSYAHSFYTIVKEACSIIPTISMFFANVTLFENFFVLHKPFQLLHSHGIEIDWTLEYDVIKNLYQKHPTISQCCETIINESAWSNRCIYSAIQLSRLLEDREFKFFVSFFYIIYHHISVLNDSFENRKSCGDIMTPLQKFETSIADMMEAMADEKASMADDAEFKVIANEACGIIITEIRERFQATDHLLTFSVIDPKQFRVMHKFPHDHVQVLACRYRMLTQGKLTNELKVVYNNGTFSGAETEEALLSLITDCDLLHTFTELSKLVEIALASPVMPANHKNWISASVKLRRFMKANMPSDRLLVLATMILHSDFIENMPDFNDLVIQLFATKGRGRSELIYASK